MDDCGRLAAAVLVDGAAIVGPVIFVATTMPAAATAATAATGLITLVERIAGIRSVGAIAVDFVLFHYNDIYI